MTNEDLVDKINKEESLIDVRVLEVMKIVDRRDFLGTIPSTWNILRLLVLHLEAVIARRFAYTNQIMRIGYGQTCSQPSLVARMAHYLDLEEGMSVLEIGTGSGYSGAITSHLIEPSGYLVTLEFISKLTEVATKNLTNHLGSEDLEKRLKVINEDGSIGYEPCAPYDRIYLTAGVNLKNFDPLLLTKQLKPEGGILLFPEERGSLIKQWYENGYKIDEQKYGKVYFVPLKGQNS